MSEVKLTKKRCSPIVLGALCGFGIMSLLIIGFFGWAAIDYAFASDKENYFEDGAAFTLVFGPVAFICTWGVFAGFLGAVVGGLVWLVQKLATKNSENV